MSKKPKKKTAMSALGRLLHYIGKYKARFIIVLVCILISAVVGVVSSVFIETLIDSYITPMVQSHSNDFSDLARTLCAVAGVFLIGVLATLMYNRLMVTVAQGMLKDYKRRNVRAHAVAHHKIF